MAWPKGKPRPKGGRPPGTKNKITVEVQTWARGIAQDDRVRDRVLQALLTSEPLNVPLLALVLAYGYGKPKDSLALTGGEGGPLQIVIQRRALVEEPGEYLEIPRIA